MLMRRSVVLRRVGGTAVVTIPLDILKHLQWSSGTALLLTYNGTSVTIESADNDEDGKDGDGGDGDGGDGDGEL
jgi:antitoxin component of MazEF toxin-antitoxin module